MGAFKVRLTAFTTLKQTELANYAQGIIDNMNQNPTYADFQVKVTQLMEDLSAFTVAMANVRTLGGQNSVNIKDRTKETLLTAMRDIGNGLSLVATMPEFVTGAGFDTYRQRSNNVAAMLTPALLTAVTTGVAGQLLVEIEPATVSKGTLQYIVEYRVDPESNWMLAYATNYRRFTISGLPASVTLQVRVRASGTRNRMSAWSSVVNAPVV